MKMLCFSLGFTVGAFVMTAASIYNYETKVAHPYQFVEDGVTPLCADHLNNITMIAVSESDTPPMCNIRVGGRTLPIVTGPFIAKGTFKVLLNNGNVVTMDKDGVIE